ncbi:MAG: serine/threonine-protein phosphatase [Spirochaetia bacterium]|nr:serine/threonine-protein phosphatase [Spirochaetia bacterium]
MEVPETHTDESSSSSVISFLDVLIEHGLLSPENRARVEEIHRATGESHAQILVNEKILNEKQLYSFIQNRLGMNPQVLYSDRNFRVAGLTVPKFSVSGDFYGCFPLDEGRIAITLSDVSGKGLEAGILAIVLANLLRNSIRMKNTIPSTIMRKINGLSKEFFGDAQFATFMVLIMDVQSSTVEFCCAGTPPILIYRQREKIVEEMEVTGIPIGIFNDFLFTGRRAQLNRGDVILLYTDGAYEAQNWKGEFYGLERVKRSLQRNGRKPADRILNALKRELRLFSAFKGLNDDTTFIVIKKSETLLPGLKLPFWK